MASFLRLIGKPRLPSRLIPARASLAAITTRLDPRPFQNAINRVWRFRFVLSGFVTEPWRLLVGIGCVIVPALLLAVLAPSLPVTTPGVVLLLAVALSSYLADWVGGITALALSSIMLDMLFVGDRSRFNVPGETEEILGFSVTIVCGAVLIWLIERVKGQSVRDRRAAVAARSAATALVSLETVAASTAPGDVAGRQQLFDAIVRALTGIYRAHAGALYLTSRGDRDFTVASSYGFSVEGHDSGAIAHLTVQGRRPVVIDDIAHDPRFADLPAPGAVRSVLAAPVYGADDRLLGVVMIGLLVRHQFSATEVAKIGALARQVATVIETANAVDARETLLRRAQDEQRRLELVIAAMPEAVVLAAPPDGRIIAANDAALDLFGPLADVDLRERLRRPDGEVCDIDDTPFLTALRTGHVEVGIELLAVHPKGDKIPVLVSAAPVREPDGSIAAVVAVFRDIGALKQASRIKDEFVSVVSHELRSPLTPIRGFVQLVAKDLDREGGHESHVLRLRSIAGHVDRMTRLVDDLLDVSRLKAGSLDIRRGPTDLVAITRDVVQVRASAAAGHRLRLEATTPSIVGDWDDDRLHQVIDNLVNNAIKYSPPGGLVTVSLSVDSATGEAKLAVADEGPGIPAEDRERVFGAFYRTRSAASSHVSGLGLGLYICHELVVAHGGTIETGAAPSGGAVFTVRLPLAMEQIAA